MTYFKFLLIAGLSVFLNHCGQTPTNELSDKEKQETAAAALEQKAQLNAELKKIDCLKGTYTGELDTTSKFWGSVSEGIMGGDNIDVTVSIAHNDRPEDLQVLFVIESEKGSICSSYGDFSYEETLKSLGAVHELTFSSGRSVGKIGTRGSVVPIVSVYSAENGKCISVGSLKISDVSNSALTLENENTSSLFMHRKGEISFDDVKVKCEQAAVRSAQISTADGSAEE